MNATDQNRLIRIATFGNCTNIHSLRKYFKRRTVRLIERYLIEYDKQEPEILKS
jgi:hypothetical protein